MLLQEEYNILLLEVTRKRMSEYLLMVAYHVLSLWCCEVYGLVLCVILECFVLLLSFYYLLNLGAITVA